ncbi:MAG: hypothetical protein JSU04_20320 [Bdellovibrionales bacterium]|nr:hypothetical protein [Bdellovibrionales bacterium]
MVGRRYQADPRLLLSIWKKDGTLWYAEPDDLRAVILAEAAPEELIRSRMGYGYHLIQEALEGKRLSIWSISFIEHGILIQSQNTNSPLKY